MKKKEHDSLMKPVLKENKDLIKQLRILRDLQDVIKNKNSQLEEENKDLKEQLKLYQELPPPSDEELPPEEYKEVEELIYSDTQYKELEEKYKWLDKNFDELKRRKEKIEAKFKKSKELAYQLIEDNAELKKEIFEIKINKGE